MFTAVNRPHTASLPQRAMRLGQAIFAHWVPLLLLLVVLCGPIAASPAWAQGLFSNAGNSSSIGHSERSVVQTPQVRAELVALAPDGIHAGDTIYLGLLLEHADGWHTYWKNPGDSGLPTELQWQLPDGWLASDIQWPTPLKLRIGQLANYGYEGLRLLPVAVTIPADWAPAPSGNLFAQSNEVTIGLQANWLVCKLECIPEFGDFSLTLPVELSTALQTPAFQDAWLDRPVLIAQAGTGSYAAAQGDQLTVRLEGLPNVLHGQELELFVDTPAVLQHGARAKQDWQQRWEDGAWIAQAPLSPDRSASPSDQRLNVLVTRLSQSEGGTWDPAAPHQRSSAGLTPEHNVPAVDEAIGWELVVPITTGWTGATQAQPSPALLQALTENAQAHAAQSADAAGAASAPMSSDWSWREWGWMLLFAFLGGLILNLMPCVFPILAIKALSIAQHSHRPAQRQRSAWAYGAGVVLSFAALGAAVLVLRGLGTQLGWGFQLQSPWFVAAMALLFSVMGLALAGLVQFGVWLPQRLRHGGQGEGSSAAFGSGVLAALVASPCTGPFMGAALGAALGFPFAAAISIFVIMGMGMALPMMALVWFPQLINRLPRPGAWMDTFRLAMAFPMFATVVWLLWVLAHQVGINGVFAWLAVLWALSFICWLLGKRPASTRAWTLHAVWWLTLALPLSVGFWSGRFFVEAITNPPAALEQASSQQGLWQPWSAQAQTQSLAAKRPVFVDFTASWCITCQYNKATTLADAEVLADFAAADVQLLRADWTRQNPEITQALTALGRSGVPTYALHVPGQEPVVMTEILDKAQLRELLQKLR
ncbi:protein-disulfide reductase DsbD family protein [Lampropedia aestuarii]|uniref:protein-disulfide reductase DsbD family protein n=1 Tax=Lampropedia aestuarii TaxID=2562762 RepID=UPI002468676D|nr:thioredoxin family protein [Lampropedia aestuarii]MDH5857451.1 thioredoxin family protein [Lampropedia aestuarii]